MKIQTITGKIDTYFIRFTYISITYDLTESNFALSTMEFIINYDPKKQAEQLFSLKLKIFEKDQVKDYNDNDIKAKIRQAKTPLDVLLAYKEIITSNR